MFYLCRRYGAEFLRYLLWGCIVNCLLIAAVSASSRLSADTPAFMLKQAASMRTSDHAQFTKLIEFVDAKSSTLTTDQLLQLRYLKGWNAGYQGYYPTANALLNSVIAESSDVNLRYSSSLSLVNNLVDGSNYEEAFRRLSELLIQLPLITDIDARAKGFSIASLLYEQAGQYELAFNFADKLIGNYPPSSNYVCIARYVRAAALYHSGKYDGINAQFDRGIDSCLKTNDKLYANGIRFFVASLDLKRRAPDRAIALLRKNYPEVQATGYPWLISQFDALLAQAYWIKGDSALANQFALAAIGAITKNEFAESITTSYRVLYLVARRSGDMSAALNYHEKYMAADKGYLNDVSAKALAYQIVSQRVLARKLQVDTLSKQNQILKLQQSLNAKAAETSRLSITLLLTILASIAYWAYRLKLSQMRFMKLARRDGLTGIYNRQHFVASAERQLQYCEKSGRVAGLIVIDLDHFKIVNDTHGHAVGDHILKRAVAACEAHLRSTDVFGRLGGEEFGILMPECDKHIAAGRADLIRMAIASVSDSEEAAGVVVSASFGVSSTTHSSYNLRQLLIHADKALYEAKRGGRNRVVVFADVGAPPNEASAMTPLNRR